MARFAWIAALGLLVVMPARSQAQQILTLQDVVAATLEQNPSLRATRAGVAEAQARITEARAGFWPRISFSETWQRGDQPVFVFSSLLSARRFAAENFVVDALNHPDPIGFFRTSVGVEQVVFDGGRQRAAATSAHAGGEVAALVLEERAAHLALTATQTFGRLLSSQAARQAAQSGLDSALADLALAERRRDAGMATEADVLALAVHAADLRQRVIQADGDAAVGRAELNRLMGHAVDRDIRVAEPRVGSTLAVDPSALASLLAEAEAARPEVARAALAERLADIGRRQARAGLLPQVVAQAAFDVSGTRFGDRAAAWLVGGELRWTFSTGGAELARLKIAAESAARARAERDDARAAIHVEVVAAVRTLEAARARESAGRAAVEMAGESQRMIRDRFDAGLATVNDVLRAATAVLDAETNRTAALVGVITGEGHLRRALGRDPRPTP
jgi:outer membrane protein TolC